MFEVGKKYQFVQTKGDENHYLYGTVLEVSGTVIKIKTDKEELIFNTANPSFEIAREWGVSELPDYLKPGRAPGVEINRYSD